MREDRCFKVTKDSNLILYGAATTGTIMLEQLQKQGFRVSCFIDKRAHEMKSNSGVVVKKIDSKTIDRSDIVIVAIKNVFEHTNVANMLIEQGFHNIIYRSIHVLEGEGNADEIRLNEAYDLIQGGRVAKLEGKELPCTSGFDFPKLRLEFEEFGKAEIAVRVPITMIFTDKKDNTMRCDREQPLIGFLPHIQFVDSVLGLPEGTIEGYLDFCRRAGKKIGTFNLTKEWEQNVIKNRAEVILRMNHAYEHDPSFFKRASIQVSWNDERKCFNLCSGKHRAIFLLEKGLNYLLVKMSREDFSNWKKQLGEDNTKDGSNFGGDFLIAPSENPWMYKIPCFNEAFFFNLIKVVSKEVAKRNYTPEKTLFEGMNIITNMEDNGFLKRFFDRCNAHITYITDYSELIPIVNDRKDVLGIFNGNQYDNLTDRMHMAFVCKEYNEMDEDNVLFSGLFNDKLVGVRRI